MRNGKIHLAPNDSFEQFYLAVKGLRSDVGMKLIGDDLHGISVKIRATFSVVTTGRSSSVGPL